MVYDQTIHQENYIKWWGLVKRIAQWTFQNYDYEIVNISWTG